MAYNPSQYILPPGLEQALQGAIKLQQPLLLTGEPGTGKTTLADWAIGYLNEKYNGIFHDEVLRFNTKTTSTAQDLFYSYDALAHFQAANLQKNAAPVSDFVDLQALGHAIAMSNPKEEWAKLFRTSLPSAAKASVVLIDEVDKAPRDFTNDILDEVDKRRFRLREQNIVLEHDPAIPIVIIMTSNSEKGLPDAFLRRCAFFHIEFPDTNQLRKIAAVHLKDNQAINDKLMTELLQLFDEIRDVSVRKKPATAELVGWLQLLGIDGYAELSDEKQKEMLWHNLSFLVKTEEDLKAARNLLEGR